MSMYLVPEERRGVGMPSRLMSGSHLQMKAINTYTNIITCFKDSQIWKEEITVENLCSLMTEAVEKWGMVDLSV